MSSERVSGLEVSADGRRVVLSWRDGRVTTAPAAWLFDNAEDACDPASGHRLRGAPGLGANPAVLGARLDGGALAVRFAPGDAVSGDEERRVLLSALVPPAATADAVPELWRTADWLAETPPIDFDAYMADDAALTVALREVVRRGIVLLAGAGTEPLTVERAVARFGFIRETNYGRLFDVREEARPSHLAYTPIGLDLHTDNPYRDPVPTLQVLHVIEAAAEGGDSLFADGFAQAEALRAEAPAHFETLASSPVEFAYAGPSGERYAAHAPVIETSAGGKVTTVRVNHRSLRALPLASGKTEAWYEAYLDFYRRLHAPTARIARKLAPGDMVIFDNRRLLHGRAAYGGSTGRRWLQGCYAERDGLLATLHRLTAARTL